MIRAERHFTQDAARELRTPLTVLSGELEYTLSSPRSTFDIARVCCGPRARWAR
jgi:signal transduction histidine kinase